MIAIIFGLPGTGKSFFASHLARVIGAVYLSSDALRKNYLENPDYTKQEKEEVYNLLRQKAKDHLSEGKKVVLDATFYREKLRQLFVSELKPSEPVFIEIKADIEVVRNRLRKKRPDSDADWSVYNRISEQWETMNEPHLVLQSSENNLDEMLEQAVKHLRL